MSSVVLIAEDDPFNLRLLQEVCEAAGYRVLTAGHGREVLDTVARERPHLILLDGHMPTMDGYEVLRILKGDARLAKIPVLFVTASDDHASKEKALSLGAEDYITKPYRIFEVQQRIRNTLRLQKPLTEDPGYRDSSPGDSWISWGNAQALLMTLNYEFTRAMRYEHALSCIVVRYEVEPCPTEVQAHVGAGLRTCIRNIDHLFSRTPQEFAVVLPQTDSTGANAVTERIRQHLGETAFWRQLAMALPAVQVGVVSYPSPSITSTDTMLALAYANAR